MNASKENRINTFLSDSEFNSDSSSLWDDTDDDPTFQP